MKIIGLAIFTYGFFGVHSNACAWAPQSCQNDKAQVSAMYMLFTILALVHLVQLAVLFLSNYGWNGIVVFETVILTIGLILAIILYKKKELVKV